MLLPLTRPFPRTPWANLLLALVLSLFVSSCTSPNSIQDRVMVVESHGLPVQGAVLVPTFEDAKDAPPVLDPYEIRARSSDAHGVFHVDLDDCYWASDGCYHFHISKGGYDDVDMSVSKDLFPPMLKVDLKAKVLGVGKGN
jgi:hypothetical protein